MHDMDPNHRGCKKGGSRNSTMFHLCSAGIFLRERAPLPELPGPSGHWDGPPHASAAARPIVQRTLPMWALQWARPGVMASTLQTLPAPAWATPAAVCG